MRGHRKAFSVVRVPSEEEERERFFTGQTTAENLRLIDYPSTSRIRSLLPAKDSTEMPACFNMVNCKFARGVDWSKR